MRNGHGLHLASHRMRRSSRQQSVSRRPIPWYHRLRRKVTPKATRWSAVAWWRPSMVPVPQSCWSSAMESPSLDVLWEDGDRLFCRIWRDAGDGVRRESLAVVPRSQRPTPGTIDRLAHEFGLKDYLDHPWAVRPLELLRERGSTTLVLEA